MINTSWNIEHDGLKLVILGHFLPLNPPKIRTLKTLKKFAGDIIILLICTKNHNHMLYGYWDTEWAGHNFLSFWAIFCPFIPPLTTGKWKFWKNEKKQQQTNKQTKKKQKKKPGDIVFLHMCTINEDGSWDIRCNRQNFLKFWAIFSPFYPPDDPENQNFEKISLEILSFYTCKP